MKTDVQKLNIEGLQY